MPNWTKEALFLSVVFAYQSSKSDVFFHCLVSVDLTIFLMMVLRIALLILPRLDLDGFIKQHGILFRNSSLWSLIVLYASVSCTTSARSAIDNFSVMFLAPFFHFVNVLIYRLRQRSSYWL